MEADECEVVSSFFCTDKYDESIGDRFLEIMDELNLSLQHVQLPEAVECVYNSTIYAREPFEMYIRKYCDTKKSVMYFGMNPGPWGMSQTGVPFGEINSVRQWLGIEAPVGKPPVELKSRPVKGFACTRTEISGKRFWGLFKKVCKTPDNFFRSSFIYNYLPQQWMKQNGCNVTPGDFKAQQMQALFNVCDEAFVKVVRLYEVKKIVAIGKFCEARAQKALRKHFFSSPDIEILYMPHPSPRVVNNNNWDTKAMELLHSLKLMQYYQIDGAFMT